MNRFERPNAYAVWSKDSYIRFKSTSGGAFSEFAKVFLAENGLVVGAKFNSINLAEHDIVSTYEGVEELRQSKYLSSSLGSTYKRVLKELENGKKVAFCGTPCQVAGLYSYIGNEYENLFTMDFICRGVNSPKAFKAWIKEIEEEERSKVAKVWFKYKDGGWRTSPRRTRVDFCNGTFKVYDGEKNLYMDGYLSTNLYIRPSCGNCQFKGVPRKSDVTFADYWGIDKKIDDDKGASLILINSEKGKLYFEKIKDSMVIYKSDFDNASYRNEMFQDSVFIPSTSHDFLMDLDRLRFSVCLKKYKRKNSFTSRMVNKCKRILKNISERL